MNHPLKITNSSSTYYTPCHPSSSCSHTPLAFHLLSPRLLRPIIFRPFSILIITFLRLIFLPPNSSTISSSYFFDLAFPKRLHRILFVPIKYQIKITPHSSLQQRPITFSPFLILISLSQATSSVICCPSPVVSYQPSVISVMQNKPNCRNAQMNVTTFSQKYYKNIIDSTIGENKPKQTQFKSCPDRSRMGQFSSNFKNFSYQFC